MKEKVSENKNMPLLGIIVPVYNTEKYVKECFDSLFNQAYKNIHVIVVDDCSPGNIKDIFDYYQSIHPNMTLVRNETNKGLFLARVEGIKKALSLETVPDYIAFLDSDDYVSTGIYDSLIQNALTNESDIVSGEHIEVHQDYSLKFNSLLYENDYLLDSKGLLDNLFKQHYYDFSWWIVWNKIYKTDVIKNSLSDLEIVDKHLVMTEDVLFSTIFFSNCSKFTNSRTGDFFYYRKTGEDQSTNVNSSSVEKFKKAIDDIEYSFNTANTVLEKHNLASEYSHDCVYTKNLLFKQYKKLVLNTNLSKINKKKVLDFIDSKIDLDVDFKNYQLVNFATTPNFDFNEHIKKDIVDPRTKIVSFDIFDTLIVRPFLEPKQLFDLMGIILENTIFKNANIFDFTHYRVIAEENARQRKKLDQPQWEEVTLDEIYEEFNTVFPIISLHKSKIKALEIELETKLCYRREYGCQLFEFARRCGKKVVVTSDMYLPLDTVKAILDKNGIHPDEYYLSSDVSLGKWSGNLFDYVIKKENVQGSNIVHIGDNNCSDVDVPKKYGIRSFHLYRAADVFIGKFPDVCNGAVYEKTFKYKDRMVGTFDSLCTCYMNSMLGVVANKIFDNPFVIWNKESDFNAKPSVLGYYYLGMDLFNVCRWLYDSCEENGINHLHFIARDGFLVERGFQILNNNKPLDNFKIYYSYFNRKTIAPLLLVEKDNLYTYQYDSNVVIQSPKFFFNIMKPVISNEMWEKRVELCELNSFHFETKFANPQVYFAFVRFFEEKFYDKNAVNSYINNFRKHFDKEFSGKPATFDVGYSLRVESILKSACGYDIAAHYLNTNGNKSQRRSEKYGIKYNTYYDYTPSICGGIREILFSEPSSSCIGFNDNFEPLFKDEFFSFTNKEVIGTIQSHALKFIKEYLDIFGDYLPYLRSRKNEGSLPLNRFLSNPTKFDQSLFNIFIHEDDMGQGVVKLIDEWDKMISECQPMNTSPLQHFDVGVNFSNYRWPTRWLVMFLTLELGNLKIRAKHRLRKHKILYGITKGIYKFNRGIFHLIFRRHKKSRNNVMPE